MKRTARALVMAMALAVSAGPVMVVSTAMAQVRGPVQRTVHGKVLDKSGAAVKGAVVYLQDSKSTAVKSAIADDEGSYRFVQLAGGSDYTLWAKNGDARSKNKGISSFDSRNDYEITLTLD